MILQALGAQVVMRREPWSRWDCIQRQLDDFTGLFLFINENSFWLNLTVAVLIATPLVPVPLFDEWLQIPGLAFHRHC